MDCQRNVKITHPAISISRQKQIAKKINKRKKTFFRKITNVF